MTPALAGAVGQLRGMSAVDACLVACMTDCLLVASMHDRQTAWSVGRDVCRLRSRPEGALFPGLGQSGGRGTHGLGTGQHCPAQQATASVAPETMLVERADR